MPEIVPTSDSTRALPSCSRIAYRPADRLNRRRASNSRPRDSYLFLLFPSLFVFLFPLFTLTTCDFKRFSPCRELSSSLDTPAPRAFLSFPTFLLAPLFPSLPRSSISSVFHNNARFGYPAAARIQPNKFHFSLGRFPFDGSRLGAIPSRHVAYARSANKGLFRLVVADMIYGKGEGNVVGRVETGLQLRPRYKGSGVIGDARPLSPLRAPTCTNATTCHLERGKEASERTRRRKKEEGQSGALEKRLSAVKNAASSSFA